MDNLEPVIDHTQPPTTVRELGIHQIYMSRSITEIKQTLSDLSNSYASNEALAIAINERRKDMNILCEKLNETDARVTILEKTYNNIVGKVAGWAISIVAAALLAYSGFEEFIK